MKDPSDRLTLAQAGELLGVDRSTVWRWVKSGKLYAVRQGLRTLYTTHAAIDKFKREYFTEYGDATEGKKKISANRRKAA